MKDYSLISKSFHNYEHEKRHDDRVELNQEVNFYSINGNKITSNIKILNISVSGLCIVSHDCFAMGDVLEFIIHIPGYISMQILSFIVWRGHCDDGFIYGTLFVSMNNLNRDIIKMYITDKLEKGV